MLRSVFLLVAAFAVFAAARPCAGQKFIPKSIQFQGDPEYSTEELMAAAGLKKGAVLTTEQMNDTAKKLMSSGVFDQVAYKFDGQDLIFSMAPASELFLVRIDNLPLATGPTLDAELHSRFPLYHGKVPGEGGLLDDVRGALESMLAGEGINARVTVVPYGEQKLHNKVTAMSFTITSPPVRLGTVQIDGASPTLLSRLQAIASRAKDLAFDSNNSSDILEQRFASFYQDQGYAAAQIQVAQSGTPVMTSDSIQVPYRVSIREGKVYQISAIHLPADSLLSQEEADKIITSRNDQMPGASLREVLMRIDERYKSKGYLDLVVTPHPELHDADSRVNYTIEIEPGAVYHVAYVKFDNVNDELRNRLMRQWQLMPGDPLDVTYLDMFMTKAENQDPVLRRSLAGVLAKFETSADPVTHEVDVVIHLEK
jgi:outer membrane protein assembly factor BamA